MASVRRQRRHSPSGSPGAERERLVVVVTTPSGRHDPWIEIDRIVVEVGDLADVHLMATGAFTWSFSAAMPPMTQVFGGAGRVYPVGHAWTTDPRLAPLRFAYAADEGPRATDRLIDDAMTMAALAGLGAARPSTRRRHVEGVVSSIVGRPPWPAVRCASIAQPKAAGRPP